MFIIIDTHIFLWALSEPKRIAKHRKEKLEDLSNTIYVSSISIAEIAIKSSIGKLNIKFDPIQMITACGFTELDFGCADAMQLKDLPFYHRDPFDRMLIAQSLQQGYPIMTDDEKFKKYNCKVI